VYGWNLDPINLEVVLVRIGRELSPLTSDFLLQFNAGICIFKNDAGLNEA